MYTRYFDIGMCKGHELRIMTEDVFPSLQINEWDAYGFEPCKEHFNDTCNLTNKDPRIHLINMAISDFEGEGKLYHCPKLFEGHSLFKSKKNVSKTNFETVQCTRLSTWIHEHGIDLRTSFNILRMNIEGSEWKLIQDVILSGLRPDIHVFCGAYTDVQKIGEYEGRMQEYLSYLTDNNVIVHPFCKKRKEDTNKIREIIKKAKEKHEAST